MAQDVPRFGNKYTKNLIKYRHIYIVEQQLKYLLSAKNVRYVLYQTDVVYSDYAQKKSHRKALFMLSAGNAIYPYMWGVYG